MDPAMPDVNMINQPPQQLSPEQLFLQQLVAQQVQQQTAAVNAELVNLRQQLQAQAAAAQQGGQQAAQQQPNGIGTGARPSKPSRYNGALGSDPTVWLFQFKQYASITHVPATQLAQLAATYLDDKAAKWCRHRVAHQPTQNPDTITWAMFNNGLLNAFKPVNSKEIARIKLDALGQKHSVQKYNDDFRSLIRDIDDMSNADVLFRYMQGLKS